MTHIFVPFHICGKTFDIVIIRCLVPHRSAPRRRKLRNYNFDYVFYVAGVDIHFNDRLGKLKISDEGIKKRDEIVTENFFSKGIPLCGVLGGGYNKDFNKLVELHSYLHQSSAKLL